MEVKAQSMILIGKAASQENRAGMKNSRGNWMFTNLEGSGKGDLMPHTA